MHVIGDYSFDVISHETRKANGGIKERFVVDAFYQGKPLNWHPNSESHDFPGIPNRQIFEWIGRESVDVYNEAGRKVGTKRGADFRTRFWPTLMLKAEKALIASQGERTIAQISDAELQKAAFVDPVDLKAKTIEQATDSLVIARSAIPDGSVVNDSEVDL